MRQNTKISVIGAAGKMGQQIMSQALESEKFTIVGAIEAKGSSCLNSDISSFIGGKETGIVITDDPLDCIMKSDAIIDFSTPSSTIEICELIAQARKVHVIGTTGFDVDEEQKIKAAARHATIIKSGNMSLGVNALLGTVKNLAKSLDSDWDIEISDMHHKDKVDSPSGTALELASAVAKGREIDIDTSLDISRNGSELSRKKGDIGIVSLRGGTVIGDHSVVFAGKGERIVISHFAENRNIFVNGALKSAEWGVGKGPGLFSAIDVLGIEN
tara:strand:- start:255 stop:1070 length:816 start_codon:yes stop_codon:yes gene_type:complete